MTSSSSYVSPFHSAAAPKQSLLASLFFRRSESGSAHELFGMHLRADCAAELASVPPLQLWQAMLDDGRADDFLRSVAAHVVDGAPPPPSFGPSSSSSSHSSHSSSHNSHSTGNGSHRPSAARKRVPVATPAPAVDDRSALLRICGEANADVLREHGIVGLAELRGAPTAVLQDLVPDVADVDLWPQMAAALADGKSWFDVERVKAARSLRVRSPPSRLRAAASPRTPQSRGKRSQPASASSASKRKKPAAAPASASKSSKKGK
jgi:hypothetical protein